jgi:HK97 family phage prohead protease
MPSLKEITEGAVQYRNATVESIDVTTREMMVRAVPYGEDVDIGAGITETFERGAFANAVKEPHRLCVWHDHGGPLVGRGMAVEDRSDSVHIRARIASTAAAKEMLTLIDEKILTDVSVEFGIIRQAMTVKDLGAGEFHVKHKRAHLRGFAMVPEGAYREMAYVESVRSAERGRDVEAARAWLLAYQRANPFDRRYNAAS